MAFRPSQRTLRPKQDADPDLTPIMNLMVVLIPLLLTSAQFIKLGMIEINLPPAISADAMLNMPKETEKKLDLSVTITDEGFYLASSLAVARGRSGQGPTIPKLDTGEYDFAELNKNLYKIKKKATGVFKDVDQVIIVAEPEIEYQTVVSTMDAARAYMSDQEKLPLFPTVSLSATVM
ncbi:MAG: biopolymer transporter ExbD [bacterium]